MRYSYSPNRRFALILDAPFTYNSNGGASTILGSLGIGIRYPVTSNWSITSVTRLGTAGSLDLCTGGNFFSAGMTSVYNYKFCNHVLSLTNYAAYFSTVNLWVTGLNANYHLQNYVLKNGLTLTSCKGFTFCGRALNYSVSLIDSYFTRDKLYIKHYDEIGVALLMRSLSVGLAYQFGEQKFHGYAVNIDYQF